MLVRPPTNGARSRKRLIFSFIVLIAIFVAGNSIRDAIVSNANQPPGMIYQVNGHAMRIDCIGTGSPTIVLDAGLGNDGLIWGTIQPVLAKTTRVCSYDRAGFGWSDPLPPPRDATHIAVELHGLLTAARIDGPILLMGHSIAGLYIRSYATRYPASVAGLVFLDGSTPTQKVDRAFQKSKPSKLSQRVTTFAERVAFLLRLSRLFGACPGSFPGFQLRNTMPRLEGLCHEHLDAYLSEREGAERASEATAHTDPYGALPILIFSRDTRNEIWNQKQENLKRLSTRSRRIIARSSGHYIQLDRPELVEREVRLFVEQIRGVAPQPAGYGSTAIE